MAQFDIYRNRSDASGLAPYLLQLQADVVDALETAVVAPLRRAAMLPCHLAGLHPRVELDGETYILSMPEMAGVSKNILGERVLRLDEEHRGDVVAAIDLLFTGV